MGRGDWRATVHGVTKSQTQLRRFTLSSKISIWIHFLRFKRKHLLFNILLCISLVICTLGPSLYPRPLLTQTMMRITSPTYPTIPFINSQGTLENMRLVPNHLSFLLAEVHTHLSLEPSHCGLSVVPGIPGTLTSLFCLALQLDIHGLSFQESVNTWYALRMFSLTNYRYGGPWQSLSQFLELDPRLCPH